MEKETAPDLNQIQVIESLFLECIISNPSVIPTAPSEIAGFTQPSIYLGPMMHFEERKIAFDIRIQVNTVDNDNQPLPVEGSFRIYIAFRVANLSELVRFDERFNQELPTSLLTASLIGTAYSTARGMLMSKVSDTVLAGFALPLRSVRQLMEESQPSLEEAQAIRANATEKLEAHEKKTAPRKQRK